MRRAAKKDANHNDIQDGLLAAGYCVMDLSQSGNGVPDLCVGKPRTEISRGWCCLVEVKDGSKPPSARRLTKAQEEVLKKWDGPYIVALSLEDALTQLAALQGEA
jgi:hypothetical protein